MKALLQEAYKKLDIKKESPIRVITTEELEDWERTIDQTIKCLIDEDATCYRHDDCITQLERITHEIMTVKL